MTATCTYPYLAYVLLSCYVGVQQLTPLSNRRSRKRPYGLFAALRLGLSSITLIN